MPIALVTGASGFIGPHLVSRLKQSGYEVICSVRKTSNCDRLNALGVRLVVADVTDAQSLPPAVATADVVFHVAGAIRGFTLADFLRVNETGVENVAQACAARANPPLVVLVSSLGVCGPSPADRPLTEADPPRPVSDYGKSKHAGERAACRFADKVPLTIVRPALVFGEGDEAMFNMFRPISRFHLHFVPTLADRYYSFIHADDLATLIVQAAERGQRVPVNRTETDPTGIYFGAGDEHPTYAEFGRSISQALGQRWVRIQHAPQFMAWAVAGAAELGSRIIRKPTIMGIDKMRDATAGSWSCSNAAATRELGFRPAAPLLERLKQTVAWYRKEGWL